MAKRKLTSAQRKARKRSAYYKREYYKTRDALEFLQSFTPIELPKIPNKIIKTTLKTIQKEYQESKRKIKERLSGGYVDLFTGEYYEKLPTKEEMVKKIRTEQPYRTSRAESEEAPAGFDPTQQYMEDIKAKIEALAYIDEARNVTTNLEPRRENPRDKSEANYSRNVVPKLQEATFSILSAIDQAVALLGADKTAEILADNDFIQRIENLEEKYAYEIIESVDDDLLPLIDASVTSALEAI